MIYVEGINYYKLIPDMYQYFMIAGNTVLISMKVNKKIKGVSK